MPIGSRTTHSPHKNSGKKLSQKAAILQNSRKIFTRKGFLPYGILYTYNVQYIHVMHVLCKHLNAYTQEEEGCCRGVSQRVAEDGRNLRGSSNTRQASNDCGLEHSTLLHSACIYIDIIILVSCHANKKISLRKCQSPYHCCLS